MVGNEWQVIYKKIAKELKISEEKVREISKPILKKWNIGEIDEEAFWEEFEKQTSKRVDCKFTKDLWFQSYRDYAKDINESWKILIELKAQRVRLAIITNTIPPHVQAHREARRIDRLKELGFEVLVLSCEVGVRKPNLKIYELTLKKLNLPAEACVFVDDTLENVEAAKELGMKSIYFQTPQQFKKELIKLDLL